MSELKFIETTDETIYTDILEELENGVGEPLYPGCLLYTSDAADD